MMHLPAVAEVVGSVVAAVSMVAGCARGDFMVAVPASLMFEAADTALLVAAMAIGPYPVAPLRGLPSDEASTAMRPIAAHIGVRRTV